MESSPRLIKFGIAEAFLRGRWSPAEMADRATSVLSPQRRRVGITRLAQRTYQAFNGKAPSLRSLLRFFAQDERLADLLSRLLEFDPPTHLSIDLSRLPNPSMQPARGAASTWKVRPLTSLCAVADWLNLTPGELIWYAGRSWDRNTTVTQSLQHYRYRWIAKTSGGSRLLEIPKPRLKKIQRHILDEILAAIPPHSAAHAYRRGTSVADYVAPHTGQQILLHIDLREFFPSVRASQVHALFRTAGYPERVARVLTGLCTTLPPRAIISPDSGEQNSSIARRYFEQPHLPQGAPTSPALANLAAFWLDCRLSGLARKVGAAYTRYADDLLFSGDNRLERCLNRFRQLVTAIIHHEGFEIRLRKTRVMPRATRQQAAGIVLNHHPNIPRQQYDLLRATLHNCRIQGPASQNHINHPAFREHLLGRIKYWNSIAPQRAGKLLALFDQIDWSS